MFIIDCTDILAEMVISDPVESKSNNVCTFGANLPRLNEVTVRQVCYHSATVTSSQYNDTYTQYTTIS